MLPALLPALLRSQVEFGLDYIPAEPRAYKAKSKNAQARAARVAAWRLMGMTASSACPACTAVCCPSRAR